MMDVVRREVVTRSAEETCALGERLGRLLQRGHFVGLVGELGAGKTQLARGVAAGAEVPPEQVASPSFAIVYPYDGRLRLNHADFYRLADADELYATGFYDLLEDGATLVEWLDRVPTAAPADSLVLTLTATGDEERRIVAQASGPVHQALLRGWLG